MPHAVPPEVLERLVKLSGMMGSDHDGERATAARMASDLLRQHKLTWRDVISAESNGARHAPQPPPQPRRVWREPYGPHDAAIICLAWPEPLNDWEMGFCRSIAGFRKISGRQQNCIDRIVHKCRTYAQVAGGMSSQERSQER